MVYRKGTSNEAVDVLSRRPQGEFQAISTLQTDLMDRIKASWTTDPVLVQLISQLQQGALLASKYAWQYNQL